MSDRSTSMVQSAAKIGGAVLIVIIVIAAALNLRLGFGAQSLDCLDSKVLVTRLETPATIERGSYVVFVPSTGRMGPQFDGHLVAKKVGAIAGDTVKIENGALYINGTFVGQLDVADKAAKLLGVAKASFERTQVVPTGHIFVIGTKPHTYDSRYWGLLPISEVVGSAYPVI